MANKSHRQRWWIGWSPPSVVVTVHFLRQSWPDIMFWKRAREYNKEWLLGSHSCRGKISRVKIEKKIYFLWENYLMKWRLFWCANFASRLLNAWGHVKTLEVCAIMTWWWSFCTIFCPVESYFKGCYLCLPGVEGCGLNFRIRNRDFLTWKLGEQKLYSKPFIIWYITLPDCILFGGKCSVHC